MAEVSVSLLIIYIVIGPLSPRITYGQWFNWLFKWVHIFYKILRTYCIHLILRFAYFCSSHMNYSPLVQTFSRNKRFHFQEEILYILTLILYIWHYICFKWAVGLFPTVWPTTHVEPDSHENLKYNLFVLSFHIPFNVKYEIYYNRRRLSLTTK